MPERPASRLRKLATRVFHVRPRAGAKTPVDERAAAQRQEAIDLLQRLIDAQAAQAKQLTAQSKQLATLAQSAKDTYRSMEALRITNTAPVLREVTAFTGAQQLGPLETLATLQREGSSFARFGDGEFRLMVRPEFNLRFQQNSPALGQRLAEILGATQRDLLVGFPAVFRDAHWSGVWNELWPEIRPYLSATAVYGNSHVSRPNAFNDYGDAMVDAWRSLWAGRRVCVIAGKGSRFDVVPALFDSAASVDRIDSVAVGAFSDLPRVLDAALATTADVFLVALGPAGTVLAADLAAAGRQALDIGHLSASYLNVYDKAPRPEALAVQS